MTDTSSSDTQRIGTEPTQIDAEQPDESTVADALGIELDDGIDGDTGAIETLVAECRELRETVDQQQETIDKQQQIITDQVQRINQLEDRVEDLEASEAKTRDIAKSAIAKAEQLDADQQEDAEQLPHAVDPSTSPLDFFANCRQQKLKELFVEDSNRANTYRAIVVAKRWPEFAQERSDGSGVFFTREHVETALTAHLGEQPHRQTISRVWDALQNLGGDDLVEKRRRISSKQEPKQILAMDMETADGLLESRYLGLDLLDTGELKAQTGGVTPVVTGGTA